MPHIRSYHLGRERTEEAMASNAASTVARISHAKLAALHRASAVLTAPAIAPVPV